MTEQAQKPVVILAFANTSAQPLKHLENEYRALTGILENPKGKTCCELIKCPFATSDEIEDYFGQAAYQGRIAVFHYAGHADGTTLVLESPEGAPAPAYAPGLAAILRQQTGLHLVFLNGCSTKLQAQALLEAGVDVVIATSHVIIDEVAERFASRFYHYLIDGDTLQSAFDRASADAQFAVGKQTRRYDIGDDPTEHTTDGWPWALYARGGATQGAQWRLAPVERTDAQAYLHDLAELLKISELANGELEREALCREIDVKPGQIRFLRGGSDDSFATLLVHYLSDTEGSTALIRLCDAMAKILRGANEDKLAKIRVHLR